MPYERHQLEWLGRQRLPVWGGHLKRGEPVTSEMRQWIERGFIRAVEKPCLGYVLTELGRAYVDN